MNKRIKLEYRKTMPKNCKKVVRGTSFGNPFKLKSHGGKYTLKKSLNLFDMPFFWAVPPNPGL